MSTVVSLPSVPDEVRLISDDEIQRLLDNKTSDFYVPNPNREGPQFNCITCGGEGEFRWYEGDSWNAVSYLCDCLNQWRLFAAFTSANVPINLQRISWSDLRGIDREDFDFVDSYLSEIHLNIRQGRGLLLHGTHGTGKSAIAALIIKKVISLGYDGYYITFSYLVDMYTSTWRDNAEKKWFHRRIKNASFLVIDDLGKEAELHKGIVLPFVDEVLRHRTAQASPTIITSNLDITKIHLRYGPNIYSLLTESTTTHEFQGKDFRLLTNKRTLEEMSGGLDRPIVIG